MASPSLPSALQPPLGKTTDYGEPNPLWNWNILCQTACISISGIVFILRTYIRLWIKRVWILEDWLCCFAFAGLVTYSALLTTLVYKHGGVHQWDVTTPGLHSILYYVNIVQIWYGMTAAIIKTTILSLYLRVFSPQRSGKIDVTIRMLIIIICLFYTALTIAKICQCIPRTRIWDKSVPGTCINLHKLLISSGMFNTASDICILLVPLKGVWNLQVSRRRKIAIYAVFTVGVIAPVFCIIGVIMRFKLTSPDQTYDQTMILLWATAELATGMTIICLPTLPALLKLCTRRSSTHDLNGSSRSRSRINHLYGGSRSTDKDHATLEGDYFELRERLHGTYENKTPHSTFIRAISSGGEEDEYTSHERRSREDANVPASGILKTIKIEQSNSVESDGITNC